MINNVSLKCSCGSLQGLATSVSPETGNRIVCLCDDCQNYAKFLKREEIILDKNGGTEIFQLTPSQLKITHGKEHLKCVRLTDKGLLRWYAGCCKTPVANTMSSWKIPFVGIPHTFMHFGGDKKNQDKILGPIRAKVHGQYATGEVPLDAHQKIPLGLIFRSLRLFLGAWMQGKNVPSPFFNVKTGQPNVTPKILTTKNQSTK
jgi:hypothetical protein